MNADTTIRVNQRSIDNLCHQLRRCCEEGYFSNNRIRSKIIEKLTPRFHESDEYEVIDVEFEDKSIFVIRKSDSKIFKMVLSYMFLREIEIYYGYDFKSEFNNRKQAILIWKFISRYIPNQMMMMNMIRMIRLLNTSIPKVQWKPQNE